jgi:hypothetical protein
VNPEQRDPKWITIEMAYGERENSLLMSIVDDWSQYVNVKIGGYSIAAGMLSLNTTESALFPSESLQLWGNHRLRINKL